MNEARRCGMESAMYIETRPFRPFPASFCTDPPGALRGPLRGAFILPSPEPKGKQAVGPKGPLLAIEIDIP